MGWSEATFKNRSGKPQKVWVRTADDGALLIEEGRAEMRYSPDEAAKVYRAHPGNLSIGDAAQTPAPSSKRAPASSGALDDSIWQRPLGARVSSVEIPPELEGMIATPPGVVDAWTDGACTGNPGPAGYGLVILRGGGYREISQYIGLGTNNIAELLAIQVAFEELREVPEKIRIHTDSSYSIGVLTQNWKAKKNTALIHSIKALIDELVQTPQFVKVAGHSGIPLNERADQLAVGAVERRS